MLKTAFLFVGQGAQFVGMGKSFYDKYDYVKDIYREANSVLDFDVAEFAFENSAQNINMTEFTQPALLTVSYCAFKVLTAHNIKADAVLGLSLGEYTALVAAESMDFKTAVSLVRKRGQYMQEAAPLGEGAMVAIIGLPREKIQKLCKEAGCEVANYNYSSQVVVGGFKDKVLKAMNLAKELGAKRVVELPVSGPFHTSLMQAAADRLKNDLKQIDFKDPKLNFLTNVTGNYLNKDFPQTLYEQVKSSVYFEDMINRLLDDGYGRFIEIGAGKTLTSFVKFIAKERNASVEAFAIYDEISLQNIIKN